MLRRFRRSSSRLRPTRGDVDRSNAPCSVLEQCWRRNDDARGTIASRPNFGQTTGTLPWPTSYKEPLDLFRGKGMGQRGRRSSKQGEVFSVDRGATPPPPLQRPLRYTPGTSKVQLLVDTGEHTVTCRNVVAGDTIATLAIEDEACEFAVSGAQHWAFCLYDGDSSRQQRGSAGQSVRPASGSLVSGWAAMSLSAAPCSGQVVAVFPPACPLAPGWLCRSCLRCCRARAARRRRGHLPLVFKR